MSLTVNVKNLTISLPGATQPLPPILALALASALALALGLSLTERPFSVKDLKKI